MGVEAIPVIIDVDTGIDDAVALVLASRLSQLDVLGVTTVSGNVDVEQATDNSLRVLAQIGQGAVPVYRGMSASLARARATRHTCTVRTASAASNSRRRCPPQRR